MICMIGWIRNNGYTNKFSNNIGFWESCRRVEKPREAEKVDPWSDFTKVPTNRFIRLAGVDLKIHFISTPGQGRNLGMKLGLKHETKQAASLVSQKARPHCLPRKDLDLIARRVRYLGVHRPPNP